jgi:FKBP-type peptidyl-prolyl cis-trans isomerase FkpA
MLKMVKYCAIINKRVFLWNMSKSGLLWALILIIGVIASCEKPEPYDEDAQYLKDEILIKKWADTNKTELIKDPSGLYYKIINPGIGLKSPALTDTLEVQYIGKLLTDSVISKTNDETTYKFVLNNSIEGWKQGLPLIKEGGRIRLLIPSKMAYKNYDVVTGVPKNSVLNFEIFLKKLVVKK